MREKLNSNPIAQVAVIGVLLVVGAIFLLSSMGGGGESASNTTTTSASLTTPAASASVTATVTTPATTPAPPLPAAASPAAVAVDRPLPRAVAAAWSANRTVVLLFVKRGGIDDQMVTGSVRRLGSLPGVVTFVVPADRIARYAAITQGVDVSQVPALVVMRPKRLTGSIPSASVSYGFQSPQSVVQAVRDATYRGHTLSYHP